MAALSIIIPTLNAADHLRGSLPPLAAFDAVDLVHEVILADGGSGDDTADIAAAAGASLVTAAAGRGAQLAAGAEAASGRWLLFLHADTRLDAGWHAAIQHFIADPENQRRAGYFRFQLDDDRWQARLLARIVAWRAGLLGLPYGDQGLVIASAYYREIGGFKPLCLMEDVDLVRRIGARNLVALPVTAVTSADRYRRDGYVRRPLRNLCCLAAYFFGVPVAAIARFYA
jgi:rSAM/selenodomain-associated transferase 2